MIDQEFEQAPIGTMARVTLGKMVKSNPSKKETISLPYLHAANVRDFGILDVEHSHRTMWFSPSEVEHLRIEAGDVVVVEGGAVGKSAYIKADLEGYGFQNSILRIRADEQRSNGRFIQHCLQAAFDSGTIARECSSVSLAHFPAEKVGRFRIPLPPLETQQRIADYLDVETAQIDTTVSTLDELIEEMKSRRIELVRSSTRFDGESNKKTVSGVSGRQHEENTKGKLGSLSSTVRRGISPSYSASGLPVVNQRCIRPNGEFDPEFLRHHNEEKKPVRDELLVQAGDILINSTGTGTLGRSCLMSEVPHRLAFDSHVTLVRPRADKILPEYLGWVVESEEERLIRLSVGSTNQIELSRGTVFNLEFYYPSQEVQREICTLLDIETAKIDKIISTATELRSELLARRSALITEVVTGQRQV